jgi:hypothetical protein
MNKLSRGWKLFLVVSFIAGLFLRTLYVRDMEYKEDEEYNYTQSQVIGTTESWPAYGIPSGVYIVNPGMSIWVFAALAKITHSTTPTGLCRALQLFSLLGICLLLPFALCFIRDPEEREPWLWAFALAMVNPIAILYQRKLWPEPFLPFFSMVLLMSWYKRDKKLGAGLWGFVGALVGQIHMSGFFYAGALFLWTWAFGGARPRPSDSAISEASKQRYGVKPRWRYWFAGSVIGALPLIPWAQAILSHPLTTPIEHNWNEASQLKYWVFWISDAFGMHLGNTLGIYIGDSQWEQLSDFVRYPIVGGHATYLVGLCHIAILGCMVWTTFRLARWVSQEVRSGWIKIKTDLIGRESEGTFARDSALLGGGILMTLTNVNIRRYYMMITFPFEQFWLSRFALGSGSSDGRGGSKSSGRRMLAVLWLAQALISAHFVGYIHVNQGSPKGDYGDAYHVVVEKQKPKVPIGTQ